MSKKTVFALSASMRRWGARPLIPLALFFSSSAHASTLAVQEYPQYQVTVYIL